MPVSTKSTKSNYSHNFQNIFLLLSEDIQKCRVNVNYFSNVAHNKQNEVLKHCSQHDNINYGNSTCSYVQYVIKVKQNLGINNESCFIHASLMYLATLDSGFYYQLKRKNITSAVSEQLLCTI